jgi:hypothetical protein
MAPVGSKLKYGNLKKNTSKKLGMERKNTRRERPSSGSVYHSKSHEIINASYCISKYFIP